MLRKDENMKRKLSVILSLICMMLLLCTSCGKSVKNIPEIDPSSLITADDISVCAGYELVMDEAGVVRDGNTAEVLYKSDPIGKNDVVKVKVTQYTNQISDSEISQQYENAKSKRSSAETVSDMGEDAYIAYPSIHIYDRGCIIEITAGSGSDETQTALLKSLATVAVTRFETMMPEN